MPSKKLDVAWEPVEFTTELRTRLLLDHFSSDNWIGTVLNARVVVTVSENITALAI